MLNELLLNFEKFNLLNSCPSCSFAFMRRKKLSGNLIGKYLFGKNEITTFSFSFLIVRDVFVQFVITHSEAVFLQLYTRFIGFQYLPLFDAVPLFFFDQTLDALRA